MKIDEAVPHIYEGDPLLVDPRSPEERRAAMEQAVEIAKGWQRERNQKLKDLASKTTTKDLIQLYGYWQDTLYGDAKDGGFEDFMYWLRGLEGESFDD